MLKFTGKEDEVLQGIDACLLPASRSRGWFPLNHLHPLLAGGQDMTRDTTIRDSQDNGSQPFGADIKWSEAIQPNS